MPLPATPVVAGKAKLSRTSAPKVRTGCITCKKRHIRCDEAKPSCHNCLKSRRHCEGYTATSGTESKASDSPGWMSKQLALRTCPRMQVQLDPDGIYSAGPSDMIYFREFVRLMQGFWNTGSLNREFWHVTTPQVARTNRTLRHVAMGIGALSMWYRSTGSRSSRGGLAAWQPSDGEQLEGYRPHYVQALSHYGRSLKLYSQGATAQDSVFLSVLLLLFETLRGNRMAALDHVNHGLAVILAILTEEEVKMDMASLGPDPRPVFRELADVFTCLTEQARIVLRGRIGHSPPLPNFVQGLKERKQTLSSFIVLLNEFPSAFATPNQIPDVFDNLDDAEECIMDLQRQRTMMAPLMMEIIRASGVFYANDENLIVALTRDILGHPRIQQYCRESAALVTKLDSAFSPLFDRILLYETGSDTCLRAIHLRIRHLAAYLFENPAQYLALESLQALTPRFRELLSLSEIILRAFKQQTNDASHHLSLQGTLSWHMLLVAIFCRDPLAREEAISILREYPGHDGLWNTKALYVLAVKNRLVERGNACEGTPNEQWVRLWRREFLFEDACDRILFRHAAKNEETGSWELVEEAADISGDPDHVQWKRQPLTGSGRLLVSGIGDLMPL